MSKPFRIGRRVIWDLRKLDAAFDVLSGPEEIDGSTGWEDWDSAPPAPPSGPQEGKRVGIAAHAAIIQGRKDARRRGPEPLMSEQFPGYHHVYTPDTLAERWKCSAALIRGIIQREELASVQCGGKLIRITAATVIAYMSANLRAART